MLKKIGLICMIGLAILSLIACGPEPDAAPSEGMTGEASPAPLLAPALTSEQLIQFNEYIPSIRKASLIKIAEIRNQNEAHIQYFSNFSEYQTATTGIHLTEAEFKSYFPLMDTINKTLMEESIRLLWEFPAITRITMKIPYHNKIYTIDTSKRSIENYLKINFKKIHNEPSQKQWKELKKKYFTAKEREKFSIRFIRNS
jgi:hypothetical protein